MRISTLFFSFFVFFITKMIITTAMAINMIAHTITMMKTNLTEVSGSLSSSLTSATGVSSSSVTSSFYSSSSGSSVSSGFVAAHSASRV